MKQYFTNGEAGGKSFLHWENGDKKLPTEEYLRSSEDDISGFWSIRNLQHDRYQGADSFIDIDIVGMNLSDEAIKKIGELEKKSQNETVCCYDMHGDDTYFR